MHVRDAFAMSTTPRAVERAPQPLSPACRAERPAASAGGRAREPIGLTTALGIQQIRWSICCSSPCVLRRPTVNVTRRDAAGTSTIYTNHFDRLDLWIHRILCRPGDKYEGHALNGTK